MDDFCRAIIENVKETIERFSLLKEGEPLFVAISGGKDSLSLADILWRLGYDVKCFFIDLGIDDYSDDSRVTCETFCKERNLPLVIVDLREELGVTVREAKTKTGRSPCSVCGMVRRYLMNVIPLRYGVETVATGHNLDDEVNVIFWNIIRWDIDSLARQSPLLPRSHSRFTRKIKPLCLTYEKDIAEYARLIGIKPVEGRCPLSSGATLLSLKEFLNEIEGENPGIKRKFYEGFLKKRERLEERKVQLKECKLCGQPTTAEICSYCRLKEAVKKH
ncbi:adenine nucleotide alpha hydrolase family protein [bacterium]|nr:adenine nucleotide alpha hydrolase family protein [bacterium]